MSDVHESIENWSHMPLRQLDGYRAIVQLESGTTIDGHLEYLSSRLRGELGGRPIEQLYVAGVYQPTIININGEGNRLAPAVKAINILNQKD